MFRINTDQDRKLYNAVCDWMAEGLATQYDNAEVAKTDLLENVEAWADLDHPSVRMDPDKEIVIRRRLNLSRTAKGIETPDFTLEMTGASAEEFWAEWEAMKAEVYKRFPVKTE